VCNQIRSQNHTDETRHRLQPPQISDTRGDVQASASQPPDPHCKTSLIFFSNWDVVCLHPLGDAEHKTASFPYPCRLCLHYLRSLFPFLLLNGPFPLQQHISFTMELDPILRRHRFQPGSYLPVSMQCATAAEI
jgi:hypothetical protein